MEQLDVFSCANVFIASYFTDDRGCAHCNREHTLIYIHSGKLEITERHRTTVLRPGDCAFIRRDNLVWLQKRVTDGKPYRSIVLKFSREFLREHFQTLDRHSLPDVHREKLSLLVLPPGRPDIRGLFESLIPCFDAGQRPADEALKRKMTEGLQALLRTDTGLYASLFDFADPWKIDIMDFMERNYMNELSIAEMAHYTGRSLSTFKRDFRQCCDLTPQKWLIQRRLKAAHELIRRGGKKVSEACYSVGFKNLSHFSRVYKDTFGFAPSAQAL